MAKIPRVYQPIFAGSASNNGVFGSAQDGTKILSNDLPTLMEKAAFAQGWIDAVMGSSKFPPLEEFQALDYITTTQLAYLFQEGIPEYDATTTYFSNSLVKKVGTYQIYGSVTNSNSGNPLTNPTYWTFLTDLSTLGSLSPLPVDQLITGTNHTFATADLGLLTRRSNSGTAMADTLPGTSGALANGWFAIVENVDATGTNVIGVGGGGTINQGLNTGSIYILPGETWFIQSRGVGVYNAWRVASATLHTAPPQSSFKNLVSSWVSTTTGTLTADELVLEDSNKNTRRASSVSVTFNVAGSGANGLDTGSVAASTWYYGYVIFNPGTGTVASLLSVSPTSPTLPAGYTYASGPITAMFTDGSNHFRGYKQYGRDYQYVVGSNLSAALSVISGASGNPSTPTWTAASISNLVPTAIAGKIKLYLNDATGSDAVIAAPNNSYGAYNSATNAPPLLTNPGAISSTMGEFILESTNVYYASSSNGALYCMGFTLNI